MKSIKQQYIDLREGNMSQAQFMRNIRLTMPQYVTNVTSFDDSVRILRNKGILTEADMNMGSSELEMGIKVEMEHTDDVDVAKKIAMDHLAENPKYYSELKASGIEKPQTSTEEPGSPIKSISSDDVMSSDVNLNKANPRDGFSLGFFEESEDSTLNEAKDEKGKWTNASGKELYAQFREIDNLNGQEVLIGLDWEMEKNEELTKADAIKIVIKNLKKNPIYYTMADLAGKEGAEAQYLGGKSAQPEARQMQPLDKNMGNVVDKKMGMQPVKDVEKVKKDSDKGGETNKTVKGVTLMSLVAKSVRGLQKMDATGEKMKKIAVKEARLNDFPRETPGKIAQQIMDYVESNPTLKQYSDEITLQSNPDGFLKFGYWDELPSDAAKALSLQFNIEPDSIEADDDTRGGVFYRLTPKHSAAKVNLNKVDLMKMIREELKEITGAYGGDEMDPETGDSYINKEEQ
jgi:hypothetical protein